MLHLSSSTFPLCSGPVSKAIVKAGGKEIARECQDKVAKGKRIMNYTLRLIVFNQIAFAYKQLLGVLILIV